MGDGVHDLITQSQAAFGNGDRFFISFNREPRERDFTGKPAPSARALGERHLADAH